MSDIPPKTIDWKCKEAGDSEENGLGLEPNIFLDHKVFKEFRKLGSQDDLELLRQISTDYYEAFQESFFDCVDSDLVIDVLACTGDGPYCDCKCEPEVKDAKSNENIVENSESDEEFEKSIKIPAVIHREFNVYFTLKTGGRRICECGIKPQISHTFRKLNFEQTWIGKLKHDKPSLYKIVLQVAPYITSLKLKNLPLSFKNPGLKFAEFLNKFTNLRTLDIYQVGEVGSYFFQKLKGISLDQLEICFDHLKHKPQIGFHADWDSSSFWENGHLNILKRFGSKENMTFDLNFQFPYGWKEFQQIFTKFGHLKTITYYIKLISRCSRDLDELKIFSGICTQLDKQIAKLVLILNWDRVNDVFDKVHQLGFKNCLAQLSPYVTEMNVIQQVNKPWDILNLDDAKLWPKLLELEINGYEDLLEILKKCSCLTKLGLHVDQRLCFFSNNKQSDKENVKHYFGNLAQLRELNFLPLVKPGDKISNGSELEEYLHEILPQLESITYDEDFEDWQSWDKF